ncbi:MAG: hypothetical protein M1820_009563 [Bogoriella megaspora]|nr:MAG: hypothetical protein M1820_009563 [Bogoriella megaspora]
MERSPKLDEAGQYDNPRSHTSPYNKICGIRLPRRPIDKLWNITIKDGRIHTVDEHNSSEYASESEELVDRHPDLLDASEQFIAPSLCHPHIHMDKCFLLQDPMFADLEIVDGNFQEAMEVTGKAKERFKLEDLLRRGRRLIEESIDQGVTVIRAFVEVDDVVEFKCLAAATDLKHAYRNACEIQICAFAQHAVFSDTDEAESNKVLLEEAAQWADVDVLGSTPYVEDDASKAKQNIEWIVELTKHHKKHLDLHLDYHIDESKEPLIWFALETLKQKDWSNASDRTCVLGHCTRLTLFKPEEWKKLRDMIGGMKVSFIGLPTSDLYMMRTENGIRGTLPIPQLIKQYGFNGAIGVNNVGNAFTPQGNCDPLGVASLGVGVYQAGAKDDAEILYQCVSERAKRAIGYMDSTTLDFEIGQPADFVLFNKHIDRWRTPKSIQHVVYHPGYGRLSIKNGAVSGVQTFI